MKILLTKKDKKKLFNYLKQKYKVNNFKELSLEMNISFGKINDWIYTKDRYLPENIIPTELKLKIKDKQEEKWGQIKGGKETYKIITQKYGLKELRKRQSNGCKKSLLIRNNKAKQDFNIELNTQFLEFYGALLGDGWLSVYNDKNGKSKTWWIGFSQNRITDKDYILHLKGLIKDLFNKKGLTKIKKNSKAEEIIFCHKYLIKYLNQNLDFPIGKKMNLTISNKLNSWEQQKYIFKGIFDTDGSIYWDKNKKYKYPIIEFHMKAPLLLDQIEKALINKGFKPQRKEFRLKLKGYKQVRLWFEKIGSNNQKHLNKIARVAQLG